MSSPVSTAEIDATPIILTHTLQRISLVNWYLFRVEDLEVRGRSVLITGRNGAGKSTILDAVQTIFAGADEGKLSYNAISNDGAAVTRSLKSYCLGEVGENDGGDESVATRSRVLSNSYISLSWHDRAGNPYSFGCGFYAKKESKRVDKHFFIVKGYDLNSSDYMLDDTTVMPWKDFERRLSAINGEVTICSNSTEFRNKCCECMSAVGASQAIASDILYRTIKKGLQFRQQRNVTEFIRDYILPEREIDVVGIENDYKQYVGICEEIENARDRLERYEGVIKKLEQHLLMAQKAVCYDWVHAECNVSEIDLKLETLNEEIERLKKEILNLEEQKEVIRNQLPVVEEEKDNAFLKLNGSDLTSRIETLKHSIKTKSETITQKWGLLGDLRTSLEKIERLNIDALAEKEFRDSLKLEITKLIHDVNLNAPGMLSQWPHTEKGLHAARKAIQLINPVAGSVRQRAKELDNSSKDVEEELENLVDIIRKLESGKASLQQATESVISVLEEHNISAVPICDLAEITDRSWQWGIERFLGVWNREALLILDANGEVASPDLFESALSLYRREKEKNNRLRAVKLLNPEKISPPRKSVSPGTAPELITATNETALHYLQGLLHEVQLVDTESELRKAHRAITRDGMVAGNGALSGGNRIDFVLMGHIARQDQAKKLMERVTELLSEQKSLQTNRVGISEIKNALSTLIDLEERQGNQISSDYSTIIELTDAIVSDQATFENLSSDTDYIKLKLAYDACHEKFAALNREWTLLATNIGAKGEALKEKTSRLPVLESELENSISKRHGIEKLALFDGQIAAELHEKLEDSQGDAEQDLAPIAQEKASAYRNRSAIAKEAATSQLVSLCERHDFDGKEKLIKLPPLEQLEKCRANAEVIRDSEIVLYEQDARDCQSNMLSHFRSGVVSKLQDSFTNLKFTMSELNNALKGLRFNNFEFKFIFRQVETLALKSVYEYTTNINHANSDGGLFDESKAHEGVRVIEQAISDGGLSEISDYRNFFSYDIEATDVKSKVKRTYTELLGTGSEGEKQSPFYVALAASFVNAYRLNNYGGHGIAGGAALALFDEAMSKMDGVNTSAALKFFGGLGLQIIMAAPPETAVKVGTNIPTTMRVARSGGVVYIDETEISPDAIEMLESDDPRIHPGIAKPYEESIRKEFGGND